jgi:hypothetical protein
MPSRAESRWRTPTAQTDQRDREINSCASSHATRSSPESDTRWSFAQAVSETLMSLGVPTAAVKQERLSMSPITIGPTRSRSLLGSLSEFAFLARADFITKRDPTLDAVARELAEVPLISPFKGECASVVTRRVFDAG